MKMQFIPDRQTKAKILLSTIVALPFVVAATISALLQTHAGAKSPTVEQPENERAVLSESTPMREKKRIDSISEWAAFAIYHPYSQVNEESLFQTFTAMKEQGSELSSNSEDDHERTEGLFILSSQALIPILKATFGDQIRSGDESQRDSWFSAQPSALFTPEQTKILCSNGADEIDGGHFETCWQPKLTESYLEALADFATDSCPQLVTKEFRSNNLNTNKLVRTREFREQNLKAFAINDLKIPEDKASDKWLAQIVSRAREALQENFGERQDRDRRGLPLEATAPDLYTLSCQAMILSKEFYSR